MTNSELPKRTLGKTGIEVSNVGLGLWAQGGHWGEPRDKESLEAIDAALDAGINFFDTADVYGHGHGEEVLGKAMHGRRDQFIVATKIGWMDYDGENNRSAYSTVDKLIAGVEENLKRLGTDYIDVIQNHVFYREPNTDIFIEGFQKLQEQGKVRGYGMSSSDFEFIKLFNDDGKCGTLQIDYSLLNRTPEAEILPYCQEHDIGVIIRGALAMGRLTGKFTAESRFEEGDFRQSWHENPEEHALFLKDLEIAERLKDLENERRSKAQLALQFVLNHPAVSSVIPGGRSAKQVRENVVAGHLGMLTQAECTFIDGLVPPGGGRKIWPA